MTFTEKTPPLAPGTKVVSNNNPDLVVSGTIEGIAWVRHPMLGYLYIIQLDDASFELLKTKNEEYGYRCIAVPESDLELSE